jgi:hypothetical protein
MTLEVVVDHYSPPDLEQVEKSGETLNMGEWKTEIQNWNAVKLYQWLLLWKRKRVPARKTGNVREKRFFLDGFFVGGSKNMERHVPLRRAQVFTPARLDTCMENVSHAFF